MFPFLCQDFIFIFPLISPPLQVHPSSQISAKVSLNLSLCQFLHFLPEGQKWGAGTGWQRAGSREAAASPAQQRRAPRSRPAAGAGLHRGLRAQPGARLRAGRAPGWNSRQSARRYHREDAEARAPGQGNARALRGTPARSGLFAKPTRRGQRDQRRDRPTSATSYAPLHPAAPTRPHFQHPLNPRHRKGVKAEIAWGRKVRPLGIFSS